MKLPRIVRDIPYWFFRMRRRFATAVVAAAACLLLVHVVLGANGIAVYLKKRDENKQLKTQIQTLQDQNIKLEKNIDSLKHDPQAIEKEAREQLKYAKPGEVVYTLPEDKTKQVATQTAQNEKKPDVATAPATKK